MERQKFADLIYYLVSQIPQGKVATYGQLAFLAGRPKCARMVGYVLSRTPSFLGVPCHRVVNRLGCTAPGWPQQRQLLLAEGIPFFNEERVDLKSCLWQPQQEVFNQGGK